jgi:hypothetical protein
VSGLPSALTLVKVSWAEEREALRGVGATSALSSTLSPLGHPKVPESIQASRKKSGSVAYSISGLLHAMGSENQGKDAQQSSERAELQPFFIPSAFLHSSSILSSHTSASFSAKRQAPGLAPCVQPPPLWTALSLIPRSLGRI